jgi:hypothetical protein
MLVRPKYPDENGRKMKNPDILINDDPINSSISGLRKKVQNIESVSGHSKRTMQLRDQIRRLEALLEYSEIRTNSSYRSLFREELES